MKKEDFQNSQQATGSAESIGQKRDAQKNTATDLNEGDKKNIAHRTGLGRDRITDIEDVGGMSGRDDYAGGDNDDMNNQNENLGTGR